MNLHDLTVAIYGPMIYAFDAGKFITMGKWGRGGRALEISTFLGPVKCHRAVFRIRATELGPMIYATPYVMLLMRANPLRGHVRGGWTLEISTFFGPCEMASSRVPDPCH